MLRALPQDGVPSNSDKEKHVLLTVQPRIAAEHLAKQRYLRACHMTAAIYLAEPRRRLKRRVNADELLSPT